MPSPSTASSDLLPFHFRCALDNGLSLAEPDEVITHLAFYSGGPRNHDFVLIAITAGRPRSIATKQRFYQELVSKLNHALGLDPENVMVVITTTEAEDWSFAGGRGN